MPFQSDAQRRFMYSQHPEIAKRWREESGPQKDLPERKGKKRKKDKKHPALDGLRTASI
jgi:hypothetical protein